MELTVSDRRTDGRTDGQTDGRTDGRTDKVSYRGACYAPKNYAAAEIVVKYAATELPVLLKVSVYRGRLIRLILCVNILETNSI